jgi:serine acetyltransferase/coenzyme F420-reducing hydrogenase beta subunit
LQKIKCPFLENKIFKTKTKYLQITEKNQCSGCTACAAVCPQNCIAMQEDEEGFLYPQVDMATCIQCSKCVKVCPYSNSEFTVKPATEELALCYAAYNRNEEIRYKSSSGGMFRSFADKITSEGGVVFGAAFDKDFTVEHTYTETLDGLTAFMGSKYLQSRMGDAFTCVEQFLKKGRKVLFTGCGCQIAGLKRFLKTDDENLFCVDLICHGVDSPKIWLDYLHSLFSNETVKSINFRDKITGQNDSCISIIGSVSKHKEREKKTIYFRSWRYGLFMRPACEVCPFKNDNRVSDITIGDCWGFQKIAPELYDDKGLSSVIVHSAKGKALFDEVSSQLVFKETSVDDVKQYNSDYIRSQRFDYRRRAAFWKDYNRMPFKKLLDKHLGESRKQKAVLLIKKIAEKFIPCRIKTFVKLIYGCRKIQFKSVKASIAADKRFNETFRFGGRKMPTSFKRQPEWKFIVAYRKFQANRGNIIGAYFRHKLDNIERKTGIHIEGNPNFGRGLIIGHYGRIIINGAAQFGEQIYITHGVTVGQNATGRRKGTPVIGNKVRIGANASIVGNVRIGNDVLIAPNAFVNVDVPDHSVVVGNPCQIHHKENATGGYLGTID